MQTISRYRHFTTNEIRPSGWLRRQLEIQAEGLSGHLDKIWPDIRDSAWIGGECDGWERVPYWLDGFIPLAYFLDDEDMKARARRYVEGILERQEADGWICPCSPDARWSYDPWAIFLICKVLVLYYECTGEERAMEAVIAALKNLKDHLRGRTLFNWGQSRWFEALIPIRAVWERTHEEWLKQLAVTLATQGLDYRRLFSCWRDQEPRYEWTQQTHIVNLMMALKSEAVFSFVSGEDAGAFAEEMFRTLREYHGSPLGYINGDECLAGKSPIHGAELCSIAEAMYSFETLFEITGDVIWMERAEEYAYNFLPATISADMWTHQYLQLVNQIACCVQNTPQVFYTNNPDSNCFGLEPSYGCCTANFNQAWPKFALSTFYADDDGVLAAVPVPVSLACEQNGVKVEINIKTDYPFEDRVVYTVHADRPTAFAFSIRVPVCAKATLDGVAVTPGSIVKLERTWSDDEICLELTQEMVWQPVVHDLQILKRGALYFAAPIAREETIEEYTRDGVERKFPYCDYRILPTEAWGLAATGKLGEVEFCGVGCYPFSRENPPMRVEADMALIDWGLEPGQDYVCREAPADHTPRSYVKKTLVPYGATTLRMTAVPMVKSEKE